MIINRINKLTCMLGAVLCLAYTALPAWGQSEKPKESKYDKLFKDKKAEHARSSFISLHKVDGRVYFELPLKYLKRKMLLGATISSVTDPTYISVGMKNGKPLHFWFEKQDSSIVMKTPNTLIYRSGSDARLDSALSLNYRDPSITSFRIEAYTPDSTAVVFDASALVARPNPMLPVLPETSGSFTIRGSAQSDLTFVKTLKSFATNASVKTEFSYNYSVMLMGSIPIMRDVPTTLDVTFSVLLLPREAMTPRFADARVGVFSSSKISFPTDGSQSQTKHLAHRWRLEPRDASAYTSGQASQPIKPIIYYLDPTFPPSWRGAIQKGVLMWNKAFERIGFKNAIVVRDFPSDDPEFDPDNLKYSCIRYLPSKEENATGPSWIDPESGEIINASILVHNNIDQLLHKWRFVQTAAVDASVRADRLPQDKFEEALSYAIAHEVGHTLGFKHNMAASSAYPTESLRSASFTHRYGISASILDYARFNYVTQASDAGVNLYQSVLGPYDYHVVEWAYRYYPNIRHDAEAQAKLLERLVDSRASNPYYRYMPEQTSIYDPSVLSNDLGDDAIRSSEYGIKNLNYIHKHLDKWIKDDPDSRKKTQLSLAIAQQYHTYLKNVMHRVGGIRFNESKESSGIPRYQVLSSKEQRQALVWSLDMIRSFQGFADRQAERKGFLAISYYDQLLEFITLDLFNLHARVLIAQQLAGKGGYSEEMFFDDLYNEIFKPTIQGKNPNHAEMILQKTFVERARQNTSGGKKINPSVPVGLNAGTSLASNFLDLSSRGISLESKQMEELLLHSTSFGDPARNPYPFIKLDALNQSDQYLYKALLKLKPLLEQAIAKGIEPDVEAHYRLMLFRINKTLDISL